jgi:DNA-directed RNA polymerase subunit RPC12/RpoP
LPSSIRIALGWPSYICLACAADQPDATYFSLDELIEDQRGFLPVERVLALTCSGCGARIFIEE